MKQATPATVSHQIEKDDQQRMKKTQQKKGGAPHVKQRSSVMLLVDRPSETGGSVRRLDRSIDRPSGLNLCSTQKSAAHQERALFTPTNVKQTWNGYKGQHARIEARRFIVDSSVCLAPELSRSHSGGGRGGGAQNSADSKLKVKTTSDRRELHFCVFIPPTAQDARTAKGRWIQTSVSSTRTYICIDERYSIYGDERFKGNNSDRPHHLQPLHSKTHPRSLAKSVRQK